MTFTRRGPSGGVPPTKIARFAERFVLAARQFVAGQAESTLVLSALLAFAALWMLYDTLSTATVDAHWDNSEASLWAEHFAFGYKHPPMTAWLFALWFSVFPRQAWAAHLLNVTVITAGLGVTWRLLRNHLDRNRALFGLAALFLIPLYDIKTEVFNANIVMIPFWAAALLFYLRARRGLGIFDSLLTGACASLTVLGKYWAFFLIAGMAVAAVTGAGTRRFWRSSAPYVMAAGAAIVVAPHIIWFVIERGGANYIFLRDTMTTTESFGAVAVRSGYYLLGAAAYAIGPLILLAALRPSRSALADITWPSDIDRQQALVLFVVPLVLPALVNLAMPYRLTPDWTFPNWALLPIVLYGGRALAVDENAVAGAGLVALAATVVALVASPFVAFQRPRSDEESFRQHFQEVAELGEHLAGKPVALYWGSPQMIAGLPFYWPAAKPLTGDPLSAEGRVRIAASGLLIVCLDGDASCRKTATAFAGAGARSTGVTLTRSFLGFSAPPMSFTLTAVPGELSAQ